MGIRVGKRVKAKKKCCRDSPRCSSCPVVLKRLSDGGFLERQSREAYVVLAKPKKAALASARAR